MHTVMVLGDLIEVEMRFLKGDMGPARLKAYLTRVWNLCTPEEKIELAEEFKGAAEDMGIEF